MSARWPQWALAALCAGGCSAPAPSAADADAAREAAPAAAQPSVPATPAPTPAAPASSEAASEAAIATAEDPAAAAPNAAPVPQAERSAPPKHAQRPPPPLAALRREPPPATAAPPAPEAATALHVTMLSRGKGVPDATRAAYDDIRALLEAQRAAAVTDLYAQRIGLEGETRLCAEFRSAADAQAALAEIRRRAADIDLLNVSAGPCPPSKERKP